MKILNDVVINELFNEIETLNKKLNDLEEENSKLKQNLKESYYALAQIKHDFTVELPSN